MTCMCLRHGFLFCVRHMATPIISTARNKAVPRFGNEVTTAMIDNNIDQQQKGTIEGLQSALLEPQPVGPFAADRDDAG